MNINDQEVSQIIIKEYKRQKDGLEAKPHLAGARALRHQREGQQQRSRSSSRSSSRSNSAAAQPMAAPVTVEGAIFDADGSGAARILYFFNKEK